MKAGLLTRPEAADYIGVSVSTLARWACLREKLPYHRVGRRALYSRCDLDDFLERVAVKPVRLGGE
jgi:excisionase family DNA binding protein